MGGGASLNRVHETLVVKAYNARDRGVTIRAQFLPYRRVGPDGLAYISVDDIREAVRDSTGRLEKLLRNAEAELADMLNFDDFVSFVETGRVRLPRPPSEATLSRAQSPEPEPQPQLAAPSLPPPEPRRPSHESQEPPLPPAAANPLEAPADACLYPAVARALGLPMPSAVARRLPRSLVRFRPSALGCLTRELSTEVFEAVEALPRVAVWKKREIVTQERITMYTKIDAQGNVQELTESEFQTQEILHMESETGDFAHKETTEFEQKETFNKELVLDERGQEEFVHLKNKWDEYTHFESSMPQREEGGQAPEGEGGGEGEGEYQQVPPQEQPPPPEVSHGHGPLDEERSVLEPEMVPEVDEGPVFYDNGCPVSANSSVDCDAGSAQSVSPPLSPDPMAKMGRSPVNKLDGFPAAAESGGVPSGSPPTVRL